MKYEVLDSKIFHQHCKDGMIYTCINMLKRVNPFTPVYAKAYYNLCAMIIRLQQNVGPIANHVYLEFLTLNRPLFDFMKGGVHNE